MFNWFKNFLFDDAAGDSATPLPPADPDINPTTGAAMVPGTLMDVTGTTYGCTNDGRLEKPLISAKLAP